VLCTANKRNAAVPHKYLQINYILWPLNVSHVIHSVMCYNIKVLFCANSFIRFSVSWLLQRNLRRKVFWSMYWVHCLLSCMLMTFVTVFCHVFS